TALNEGHKERFARITAFLAKHDLGLSFADGDSATRFDEQVRQTVYPQAVRPASAYTTDELLARMQWLRDENRTLQQKLKARRAQPLREQVKQAVGGRVRRMLSR
ncbi:hypothetical protein ACWDVV_41185, partial [Streptomyces tendae]